MNNSQGSIKAPRILMNEEFLEFCGKNGLDTVKVGSQTEIPSIGVIYNKDVYGSDTVYSRCQ